MLIKLLPFMITNEVILSSFWKQTYYYNIELLVRFSHIHCYKIVYKLERQIIIK